MAGKFLDKTYKNTISSLVDGANERLKNPYYLYTDKQATIVTYYNANIDETTTDQDSNQMYSYTDGDAPLRFNKILNAYVYGINRVETDLQMEEFGLESVDIEGEAYVLPNTFTPYPQDYFTIDYLEKYRMIFKVKTVTMDTFENGANFWKIEYRLSIADAADDRLESQVVNTYVMNIKTVGTNLNPIIEKSSYDLIEELETVLTDMKNYYQDLFFKNRLQTFIYEYDGRNFYDAYMIEFLKRNNILSGSDQYVYVEHAVPINRTFSIDYANTFFHSLETKRNIVAPCAYATMVTSKATLLYQRPEDYYEITYREICPTAYPIETVEPDLLNMINDGIEYASDNPLRYNNIIIRYLSDKDMPADMIDIISGMSFEPNMKMFYAIPEIIYVLERYIKQILKK